MQLKGYGLVAVGASLWGTIGFFVGSLQQLGFSSLEITFLRAFVAAIILLMTCLAVSPARLRFRWRHLPYFIGTGIGSMVFFNWCYFQAIHEISLSVAAVLLYTGPAFVVLLSWLLLGESLTRIKLLCLLGTLCGCAFVVGWLPGLEQNITLRGLLLGLGSGLGYGLYSIIGKPAASHYSSLTITTYTFTFAALFLFPWVQPGQIMEQIAATSAWVYVLGLGFFPTVVGYLLYTRALSMLESSRASITATIEPVVAVFIGINWLGENLTGNQVLGILLILTAVAGIQMERYMGSRSFTEDL